MPKTTPAQSFTPGEAQYVLQKLIQARRIKPKEATQIAGEMQQEIADLERRLADLRGASTSAARGGRGAAPGQRKRSSGPVNPQLAASRRIQGEYMGLIRQLSGRARARIKKLASESGREAAIKEMRAASK